MNRRYDLDWIRDIVVLSIIFFHSLIIFFTRESAVMFVRAGVDLKFCIYTEAILNRFTMPILFLLAGFSIKKSLEKRTTREVVHNRFRKLFLVLCKGKPNGGINGHSGLGRYTNTRPTIEGTYVFKSSKLSNLSLPYVSFDYSWLLDIKD